MYEETCLAWATRCGKPQFFNARKQFTQLLHSYVREVQVLLR